MTITELQSRLSGLGLESTFPEVPAADVLTKPLDIYRLHLASLLATTLECDVCAAYDAISSASDLSLSDLAVILPKLKPKDVADVKALAVDITKKVRQALRLLDRRCRGCSPYIAGDPDLRLQLPNSPLLPLPYPDGVQLRFFLARKTLPLLLLPYVRERGASYGEDVSQGLRNPSNPEEGRKKVVIEFSSPNIPGEFTSSHLRSTLLGAFVAKMHECMGWDVVRLNYLGDWGKHTALFAVGWARYGSEAALEADPLNHIIDVLHKITADFQPESEASKKAKNEGHSTAEIESQGIFAERDGFFKKMEDGDDEAVAFWKRFRDIIVGSLQQAYDRLGVAFDEYSGESQPRPETMAEIETTLSAKGILEESDGSRIINFKDHGSQGLGIQVLRQRTGSSTYLLRDVGAVLDRAKAYSFDKMLYVVSSRQSNHFQQVFKTLELLGRGDLAAKLQHVGFGEPQGLATHLGTPTMLLGNVLDGCGALLRADARAQNPDLPGDDDAALTAAIGDPVAIGGLLSLDLFGKRATGYAFDVRRLTSFEGDSCLKLQREHMRLGLKMAELRSGAGTGAEDAAAPPDYTVLQEEGSIELLRLMIQYPDITAATYRSLEPHGLLSYLSKVADALIMSFEEEEDDENADEEEAEPSDATEEKPDSPEAIRAKLNLYESVQNVLGHGMRLLGVPILGA